jgi:hypothetical protein
MVDDLTPMPEVPRFGRSHAGFADPVSRIGEGGLGGKARGLIRIRDVLRAEFGARRFPGIRVGIPDMTVIASDVFDLFVERNRLHELTLADREDHEVALAFHRAELPEELTDAIRQLARATNSPLAVRSSSLLEDVLESPFAGVYGTKMIPNVHRDPEERARGLAAAIKYVYATTWFRRARDYVLAARKRQEDESMALIVQEVVGRNHGGRFYPELSAVGRSFNFYPVGGARRDQGVMNLALGLGKTIVEGGTSWSYSPAHPAAPPPFRSAADSLKKSQVKFWAIDLSSEVGSDPTDEGEFLVRSGLEVAEEDGSLAHVASTYDPASDRIVPGTAGRNPRIVDFAPLLSHRRLPFNELVPSLLEVCSREIGAAVEIEFAMTFDEGPDPGARLGFLQVRPMVVSDRVVHIEPHEFALPGLLAFSPRVMGNGIDETIRDVIHVRRSSFDPGLTRRIAGQIEPLNRALVGQARPYLLIGFGRWGTADPWLGIPVRWDQISGARAIVEATLPSMDVDPSQGSHFFQNITSFRVAYFTVRHDAEPGIDWNWLAAQETASETDLVRHVRLPEPLLVKVDGRTGVGGIWRHVATA